VTGLPKNILNLRNLTAELWTLNSRLNPVQQRSVVRRQ
jgi:hypothetical protein